MIQPSPIEILKNKKVGLRPPTFPSTVRFMDQSRAKELFDYNPATGSICWRVTLSAHAAAGTPLRDWKGGNLCVTVGGKMYRASHIAWLIVHGSLPEHNVFFRDGNKVNLAISNLYTNKGKKKSDYVRQDFMSEFMFNRGKLIRRLTGIQVPTDKTVAAFGHSWSQARLVWLLHYGEWPKRDIEHINKNIFDNRICNLRELKPLLGRKATYADFAEEFQYDALTGAITRMCCGKKIVADVINFSDGSSRGRYRRLYFSGKNWKSHRVAWLLHYGEWPKHEIDHEDHNGLNNRIDNLRDVTNAGNSRNTPVRKDSKTGISGVYPTKTGGFTARIRDSGKLKHLGTFKTLEEAAKVRREAEERLGYHRNHGK